MRNIFLLAAVSLSMSASAGAINFGGVEPSRPSDNTTAPTDTPASAPVPFSDPQFCGDWTATPESASNVEKYSRAYALFKKIYNKVPVKRSEVQAVRESISTLTKSDVLGILKDTYCGQKYADETMSREEYYIAKGVALTTLDKELPGRIKQLDDMDEKLATEEAAAKTAQVQGLSPR